MKYYGFKVMCAETSKDNYGFLVISKDTTTDVGRYTVGFDRFIVQFNI